MKSAAVKILDILIPNTCMICDEIVSQQASLCEKCWGNLTFIGRPCCVVCGVPFEQEILEGALCGQCNASQPEYETARAPLLYDDNSKKLITGFKYDDKTHLLPFFTRLMNRTLQETGDFDIVIPVPLHYLRLVSRRYNQSAIIAKAVGRLAAKPVLFDAVIRNRRTSPQFGLSRKQRAENVKGAFRINEKHQHEIDGQAVLLIDDVLTTGATVNECARALKKKGAAVVKIITLARTPLD